MQIQRPQSPPLPEREGAGGRAAPAGEAQVWLCSMGLAVGIIMTVFLLGLILVKGLEVFWPDPVALIEFKDDAPGRIRGQTFAAGSIVDERAKFDDSNARELKLYVANRDNYGFSFKYVDAADVAETTYPRDLAVIERHSAGDIIARPTAIDFADGRAVAGDARDFRDTLEEITDTGERQRERLADLKEHGIGRIDRRIADLQLEIDALDNGGASGAEVPELEAELADLQAERLPIQEEINELTEREDDIVLRAELATGEAVELPASEIVDWHFPNELGFWGKLGVFVRQLWGFLSQNPREANMEGGVFPAIFGTAVMTIIMSACVTPFGVIAAVYLREYAHQGALVRAVRISVNNLAGVPSIVFGVFGLGFFIYIVGDRIDHWFFSEKLPTPTFGTGGILWASLTLALLTLPVVIVATEEALAGVPRGVREAALACGASKWQTIQRVVLPSAIPGILTGVILAMARGAGEVAPLMLVGVMKFVPDLPVDSIFPYVHLDRKFMHLGFHIYDLGFQSPDSEAARPMLFATTLLLITLVVLLNLAAILLRNRLRRKYALAAF